MDFRSIPRESDAFQQSVTAEHIQAVCERAFGSTVQVASAVEGLVAAGIDEFTDNRYPDSTALPDCVFKRDSIIATAGELPAAEDVKAAASASSTTSAMQSRRPAKRRRTPPLPKTVWTTVEPRHRPQT